MEDSRHADTQPRVWTKPYYESFNGLRGLAVLIVFLHHYAVFWNAYWLDSTGWVGVDMFFVLSGFLITGILFDELEQPRYFRNFYIRRTLRIFPVYYGFFLVVLLLTPVLHLRYSWTVLEYVFYVGNLLTPFTDLVHHNPTAIGIFRHGQQFKFINLGHIWSLCVEEQFYLLWPAVVWHVRDRRKLMRLCVAVCVAVLLGRLVLRGLESFTAVGPHHWRYGMFLYWSTVTRCDTLLTGAWLALWLRGKQLSRLQLQRLGRLLFWLPLLTLAVGVWLRPPMRHTTGVLNDAFVSTMGYTLVALASLGFLLLALDERGTVSRVLQNRMLSGLGVVSYGFYIFHVFPYSVLWDVVVKHPRAQPYMPVAGFAITLAIAMVSFYFYESPILRLKQRWTPQERSPGG